MCGFWPREDRAEVLALPNLMYSHFRTAMRLKDQDRATAFLRECSAHSWSDKQATQAASEQLDKPTPAVKLVDTKTRIRRWSKQTVSFRLTPAQMMQLFDAWRDKHDVRLVIQAVPVKGSTVSTS